MVEPLNTEPIITKLLQKTQAGRVEWADDDSGSGFRCNLDGEYSFRIMKSDDTYTLNMLDKYGREIFRETATDEIYFHDPMLGQRLQGFKDMYELARRKATNAQEKIAGVGLLLDRI